VTCAEDDVAADGTAAIAVVLALPQMYSCAIIMADVLAASPVHFDSVAEGTPLAPESTTLFLRNRGSQYVRSQLCDYKLNVGLTSSSGTAVIVGQFSPVPSPAGHGPRCFTSDGVNV
jgi:hypothetical protein